VITEESLSSYLLRYEVLGKLAGLAWFSAYAAFTWRHIMKPLYTIRIIIRKDWEKPQHIYRNSWFPSLTHVRHITTTSTFFVRFFKEYQ
jgi:hypothetical protein